MDILFVSQRVPEPPNKGDKIRCHHLARRLARRHAVHLAFLLEGRDEVEHARAAAGWAASATWHVRQRWESGLRCAAAPARGASMTSGFFRSRGLARKVRDLRRRHRFDVVVACSSGMAGYAAGGAEAKVLDFVDVDSEKWGQYARLARGPRRLVYALEHRLLRSEERRLAAAFDRCILISEREREILARFADTGRVAVVGNGVEAQRFARQGPRPDGARLLFVGALDYFANVEGIGRFAREAFPRIRERIPGAVLRVVGHRPAAEVDALGAIEGVSVVGEVDDVRHELWAASVAVVPLRIAPGVQNKVLEAMAAGLPVVASRAALAGLEGREGEHFAAADRPEETVDAVVRLVQDRDRAEALAERARSLVRERYSWEARALEYERVLEQAARSRAAGERSTR